jgi:hypothetical protein
VFQKKTAKGGVVRSGLVAAAVLLFLRDPLITPVSDFLSNRVGVDTSNMTVFMGLIAVYYLIGGIYIAKRMNNPTAVAISAGFWTVGISVFWLVYSYSIGPILQGVVAPAFPTPEVWAVNFGVEAVAFVAVIGAFIGKLKSG